MTREEIAEIKAKFESKIGDLCNEGSPEYLYGPACCVQGCFDDVCDALEVAQTKLSAWESCGLTEEMLRDHDGYLRINRGVVMVSEHYLEELQAISTANAMELEATISERDEARIVLNNLCHQNTELLDDIAAMRKESDMSSDDHQPTRDRI